MEGVIGYTTLFAGNFAPRGWGFCAGQILAISQNTALFSILGTTYGGNGTSTFALPDLRGRVVVGAGQGPGLTPYSLGEVTGQESEILNVNTMASHPHPVAVGIQPQAATSGSTTSPSGGVYATQATDNLYNPSADGTFTGYNAALTMGLTGNSQPFPILNPVLTLNYLICLQGVYPARN